MKTYKVDCGTLHRKVEARSRESAAVKAIKLYPPRELGYLLAVTPEGEATSYWDVREALKRARISFEEIP